MPAIRASIHDRQGFIWRINGIVYHQKGLIISIQLYLRSGLVAGCWPYLCGTSQMLRRAHPFQGDYGAVSMKIEDRCGVEIYGLLLQPAYSMSFWQPLVGHNHWGKPSSLHSLESFDGFCSNKVITFCKNFPQDIGLEMLQVTRIFRRILVWKCYKLVLYDSGAYSMTVRSQHLESGA